MNWIKKSLLVVVPLLIAVFVAEIGSFFIWHYYLEDARHGGVFLVKQIIGDKSINTTQSLVSHPYSLYWNNPLFEDEYGRQYDDNGYRSPKYIPRDNEFRVLVLGGSTTNAYPYVKDPKKIWTSELQRLLEKRLNRPVHVFNAGLTYGTSAELMIHFLQNGKYVKPNLVIFHEGGNDVFPLLYPGYKTDYSHFRKSTATLPRPLERKLLTYSHFARLIYAVWLKDGGVYQGDPYPWVKIPREPAVNMINANSSEAFKNNVEVITREAISGGAKVLLVGFLQVKEQDMGRKRPGLKGLERALVLGVEKHDRIMSEIASRFKQQFFKLDQSQFRDEWFLDNCHLTEDGEREKAKQIFTAVMNSQVIARETSPERLSP